MAIDVRRLFERLLSRPVTIERSKHPNLKKKRLDLKAKKKKRRKMVKESRKRNRRIR